MAITLQRAWTAGEDNDIPASIKLHSGATVFPKDRTIRVLDEDDAQELERLGWERDAASKAAKAERDNLLRKGLNMQLTKMLGAEQTEHVTRNPSSHRVTPLATGGGGAHQRTEFGTIETPLGTVAISHDRGADVLIVHGVARPMAHIRADLGTAIVATSAAFSAAQTAEEQVGQKAVLTALINAILKEHPTLEAKVRTALQGQRFTNV